MTDTVTVPDRPLLSPTSKVEGSSIQAHQISVNMISKFDIFIHIKILSIKIEYQRKETAREKRDSYKPFKIQKHGYDMTSTTGNLSTQL